MNSFHNNYPITTSQMDAVRDPPASRKYIQGQSCGLTFYNRKRNYVPSKCHLSRILFKVFVAKSKSKTWECYNQPTTLPTKIQIQRSKSNSHTCNPGKRN